LYVLVGLARPIGLCSLRVLPVLLVTEGVKVSD
jgi:hypothetical protein